MHHHSYWDKIVVGKNEIKFIFVWKTRERNEKWLVRVWKNIFPSHERILFFDTSEDSFGVNLLWWHKHPSTSPCPFYRQLNPPLISINHFFPVKARSILTHCSHILSLSRLLNFPSNLKINNGEKFPFFCSINPYLANH